MSFDDKLSAPFPWYGGKSRAAHLVWAALGDVRTYIEPFAGSLAVLLARPQTHRQDVVKNEIVNDADQYICNFWRAVQFAPDEVLKHANWPCNEADLHSRHFWLVTEGRRQMQERIKADPEWFDAKIAGWWLWGINIWLGSGWCNAFNKCYWQRPNLTKDPALFSQKNKNKVEHFMRRLSERLRHVKVACGDWTRVLTDVMLGVAPVGIFLDPPYSDLANRQKNLYAVDSLDVAHAVREWAIEHGENPNLRIVLAGYEGEHEMPPNWRVIKWVGPPAGPKNNRNNRYRERLYLSPYCLQAAQPSLFDASS